MTADVSNPILGIDFLSAFGLAIDANHRVLLGHATSLQAHGICACTVSLGLSLMALQSPFFFIFDEFPSITVSQASSTITPHDVQHRIITKDSR